MASAGWNELTVRMKRRGSGVPTAVGSAAGGRCPRACTQVINVFPGRERLRHWAVPPWMLGALNGRGAAVPTSSGMAKPTGEVHFIISGVKPCGASADPQPTCHG